MSRTAYPISFTVHVATLILVLLAIAVFVHPATAEADSGSGSGSTHDRWTPSLAVTMGFTSHRHQGAVESMSMRTGPFPCIFGGCNTIRDPDADQKYLNAINVGGQLEIQTPALPIPVLRPSIFFGGEVQHVSSQRRSIAREGDPKPELTPPAGNNPFSERELLGRGSAMTSDLDNLQYGAHVGLSFPIQLGDWRLSIKPSARYLKQEVFFTGIVSQGTRGLNADSFVPPNIPTNVILLQDSESLDIHAVGPGLEIEIATGGVRSLAASVYISGGAYRVLSDERVDMSATGSDSDGLRLEDGTPAFIYDADWTAKIDPWIYRANIGMRFRWTGSSQGWLFGHDR